MAATEHSATEKQSQFDVQRFALPSVEVDRHYATVLATAHGVLKSHSNPTPLELQVNANKEFSERQAKTTTVLGALQILAGLLAIAFQAVATGVENTSDSQPIAQFLGCGIWCGIVFLITGLLGTQAGRKKSRSVVVASLIFSVISSIMVPVLITIAAINLAVVGGCPLRSYTVSREHSYYQNYSNESVPATRTVFTIFNITDLAPDWPLCTGALGVTLRAMDSLLVLIALFEFAAAVTSASICCRVLTNCRTSLTAFLILHNVSASASNCPYGSSMQPNMLAQGPLVHDKSLPTYAMETGPILSIN